MLSLKPHITPRYYQTESINSCYKSFKESPDNRPIIVLPTGAGKALVTTLLTIDALNWKRRILHLTHTKELVSQNAQTAIDCIDGHIDIGICSAGLGKFDLVHDCLFAGIQTFVNRVGDCPAVDLLVVDECHRISVDDDTAYKKVIDTLLLKNPKMRILGLSATPFRLGQGMLTWHVVKKGVDVPIPPIFNVIAYEAKTGDLIKQGFLSEVVSTTSQYQANLDGIKKSGGDFVLSEMGDRFNSIIPSATREIFDTVAREKLGKCIVFSSTVANAELIADFLPNSRVITGNSTDRDDSLSWFAEPLDRDNPKFLINCQILTTGFNQPDIDCIAMLFATVSVGKYIQVVGRGLRLSPDKNNCLILDYGTNIARLGTIDNPIIKASGNGECPTKQCQAVMQVIDEIEIKCNVHNLLTAKQCCECGAEFQIAGGNDKYTPLAEAAPLLSYQQAEQEYYSPVTIWDFSEHTSAKGGKSLKLRLFNGDEHIGNHWFQIRADKAGWRAHNIEMLKGFFYDDRDWYRYKPMIENESLETVATNLNAHYDMICKPIIGVKFKKDGKFNKITDIELFSEFEELDQ